ncbi:MAG: hypothetical protein PHV17_01715 [Candidatus Omnitrophica bacterium]|nr:hypothetical protein [Candidatus Omnitrophota bacterium]
MTIFFRKKLFVVFVFFLMNGYLIFFSGFSQNNRGTDDFEAGFTKSGMVNGYIWRGLQDSQKEIYLLGYEDGVVNTAIYYLPDSEKKNDVYSLLPSALKGLSKKDLVKEIDLFYKPEDNALIPVAYVLIVIRNRNVGVSEGDISGYIDYLRDLFKHN